MELPLLYVARCKLAEPALHLLSADYAWGRAPVKPEASFAGAERRLYWRPTLAYQYHAVVALERVFCKSPKDHF